MSDAIELVDKLILELGSMTTYEIAKRFAELGIKGTRCASRMCPVTNYLKLQSGAQSIASSQCGILANADALTMEQSHELDNYEYSNDKISDSLKWFMAGFDNGKYPSLIDENYFDALKYSNLLVDGLI